MSVTFTAHGTDINLKASEQRPLSQEEQSHQCHEPDATAAAVNELLLKLLVTTT